VLAALGPAPEAIDPLRHVPEVAGDLLFLMAGRVDVERGDVAALEVLRVVLGVVGPHAPAVPAVPRHALAQIEHHRALWIGLSDLAVTLDDPLRRDRRPVPLPPAERLGVVGLIAVHPADDRRPLLESQRSFALPADQPDAGPVQRLELLLGRPPPEPD